MNAGNLSKRQAFEKESFPHLDALWRIARWLTMQDSLAEEIVTNTMIRAYNEWPYSLEADNNKPRLFQILTREIYGFGLYRHLQDHQGQFLSENIKITTDSTAWDQQNIVPAVDELQLKMPNGFSEESVEGIITQFRPQSRLILLLLYIGEFSHADIAFITDLSVNSVRMILSRVRNLILKYMLEYAEGLDNKAKSLPVFISHDANVVVKNMDILSKWPLPSSHRATTDATCANW